MFSFGNIELEVALSLLEKPSQEIRYLNMKVDLGREYSFGTHKTMGVVEKKSEFNCGHNEFKSPLERGNI